jgi:acetyl/propionyl-CoA carboxylase alpha subunit
VRDAGLVFLGPSSEALERFGDKGKTKRLAASLGVPTIPALSRESPRFPLMIKADHGGGGIGLSLVRDANQLDTALATARQRATAAFGQGAVGLELFLEHARHIEMQALRDANGTVTTLGERECTIQRRNQKIIEESPSPIGIDRSALQGLASHCGKLLDAVDYVGVATIEFLFDEHLQPYFLEVNPRIQVEHAVTEMRFDCDLVEQQMRLALSQPASCGLAPLGHAIEARICAESPDAKFWPRPGKIEHLRWPSSPDIRVDSGVEEGSVISPYFDSLIAKIIAYGPDRATARRSLVAALSDTKIAPLTTNRVALEQIVSHPDFASGDYDSQLVARCLEGR